MAPITAEEQLQFLLSCIKFSNSGKIDFENVSKACGIISKGAAAKRYERLLKANNINPSGGSTNSSPAKSAAATDNGSAPTTPTPTPGKKKTATGKRKAAESKGSPKKAKLRKKVAVAFAEDLLDKQNEESDKDGDLDDDEDGSLFKGVVPDMDTDTADTYL